MIPMRIQLRHKNAPVLQSTPVAMGIKLMTCTMLAQMRFRSTELGGKVIMEERFNGKETDPQAPVWETLSRGGGGGGEGVPME